MKRMVANKIRKGTRRANMGAGVAINNPVPWSRKRPDGYELKWLLALATGSHRGVAPFLIEDVTPRFERIPQEWKHKNGITGFASITVAVGEIGPIKKWYSALLGAPAKATSEPTLGADGLRFKAGPHVLDFLSPRSADSPLINWLREYGPSPYSAVLNTDSPTTISFDTRLTHGANLLVK